MAASEDIERIQRCIRNRLDHKAIGTQQLAAVIGAAPSLYSKSPALWNAAFQALKMPAVYVPLDVDAAQLPALMTAIRKCDRCLGLNVTVPHKLAVLNYLDAMDATATRIGAVNTIVRSEDAKLLGANTDGQGFVESLTTVQAGTGSPLVGSLKNVNALILGAGGAARAVAFALAKKAEHGRLYIANRTHQSALSLAAEAGQSRTGIEAIHEAEIPDYAPSVDIIVNCTTKGQSGFLEPYSALAPARPMDPSVPANASLAGIAANNDASWKLALSLPPGVAFYDLIYHPAETVFLRHGRMSGHRTLNGRGMIVAQAAEAFFNLLCRRQLESAGRHTAEMRRRILKAVAEAW
jgi:shikimate dehydrogenase